MDGQVRPPLLTDNDHWRRVVFETARVSSSQGGALMVFQRMDDSLDFYLAAINTHDRTITLSDTDPSHKNWSAHFTYERPTQNQLNLNGEMDSHKLQMQLNLFDMKKFPLIGNGFHWIQ
ncbi:MAG TPA: hypothetical protein VGR72_01420 [Candidatus Acidoferrales bacterium]|nr:hypothetical protein [Candidatus Acidoferrales bacterium]